MTVDAYVNAVAYAILVSVVSLLAYPLIAAFFIVRSALTSIKTSWLDFSLSLLIMAAFVASISFSNRSVSEGPYRPDVSDALYSSVVFFASLGLLAINFFKLLPEKKSVFRRFLATQSVLAAMFMEMLAGMFVVDSTFDIPIGYLLIIAVMLVAVAMNFMAHLRNANFLRSRASILQGATTTVAIVASCCWVVIFDWYGLIFICFCYFLWTAQLTGCLKKIASRGVIYSGVVHILLIVWIFVAGSISFRTSDPWIS